MATIPTYCEADVARAAPATPQPNTKMKIMSMVKLATLERAADIKGVLHRVIDLATHCHQPGTCSAMTAGLLNLVMSFRKHKKVHPCRASLAAPL